MRVVLMVLPDGRASIHAATDTGMGDYSRVVSLDDIIEGKQVRDYGPGIHDLASLPPEPVKV